MTTIFLISDTHFGHAGALTFMRNYDPTLRMRDFASVDEMDEFMIERWNATVRPQDHVYHLGDFAINQRCLDIGKRLNGHKRLVRGNHDIFKTKKYVEIGFEEIHGCRVIDNMALTHVPIHPVSLKQRWLANVHGHLHCNASATPFTPELGERYFNVSVEVIDYTPISLEQIKERLKERA